MTIVKTFVAGALVASTMALAMPTPASAIGIVVGPRGGVGVRLGRPGWRGGYWHRPYVRRGVVVRRGWRRY